MIDPDCQYGYICHQQKCIEKPDPCDPNPCGPGADARPQGDTCQCTCPPGTVGDGQTGCNRGECLVDDDCHVSKACDSYFCVDPCQTGTCRATDFCRVMNHRPICGFNYEAPPQVSRNILHLQLFYNIMTMGDLCKCRRHAILLLSERNTTQPENLLSLTDSWSLEAERTQPPHLKLGK